MLLLQLILGTRWPHQPNFREVRQRWRDWWWAEIDYPLNTRYCDVVKLPQPPVVAAREDAEPRW